MLRSSGQVATYYFTQKKKVATYYFTQKKKVATYYVLPFLPVHAARERPASRGTCEVADGVTTWGQQRHGLVLAFP
jgi:hypothetical protein